MRHIPDRNNIHPLILPVTLKRIKLHLNGSILCCGYIIITMQRTYLSKKSELFNSCLLSFPQLTLSKDLKAPDFRGVEVVNCGQGSNRVTSHAARVDWLDIFLTGLSLLYMHRRYTVFLWDWCLCTYDQTNCNCYCVSHWHIYLWFYHT